MKKKLIKQQKIKTLSLFDHLKVITEGKNENYWNEISESDRKSFSPYMINRFLSMNSDWIEIVAELQKYTVGLLSSRDVFHLYFDLIPKQRIFLQYVKSSVPNVMPEEMAHLLMLYFECSHKTANEYFTLMMRTDEGKQELRNLLEKYGTDGADKTKICKEIGL